MYVYIYMYIYVYIIYIMSIFMYPMSINLLKILMKMDEHPTKNGKIRTPWPDHLPSFACFHACAERRRVCSGSVSRKVTASWLVALTKWDYSSHILWENKIHVPNHQPKTRIFEECCGLFLDAHSDSISNEGIYLGDFRHETMVFTSKYRGVRSPVDFPPNEFDPILRYMSRNFLL